MAEQAGADVARKTAWYMYLLWPFRALWALITFPFINGRYKKIPGILKWPTVPLWGPFWLIWKIQEFGWKKLDDMFLSYARLAWKKGRNGEAIWMRMMSMPSAFFEHYMVWALIGVGIAQLWFDREFESAIIWLIYGYVLVWHTRFLDLTLRRLGAYVAIGALLIMADMWLAQRFPENLPRGVLREVFYYLPVENMNLHASAGVYFLFAIIWTGKIINACIPNILDKRYELDERYLHIRTLSAGMDTAAIPRFMRPVKRKVRDILEWLSGCADFEVEIGNGKKIIIKNVFGLAWWGKKPFEDLSYSLSEEQRSLAGDQSPLAAGHEDAAELVEMETLKAHGIQVVDDHEEHDAAIEAIADDHAEMVVEES